MQMNTKEGYCFFIRHEFTGLRYNQVSHGKNTTKAHKPLNIPGLLEGWLGVDNVADRSKIVFVELLI